jgi:hypothetical protein
VKREDDDPAKADQRFLVSNGRWEGTDRDGQKRKKEDQNKIQERWETGVDKEGLPRKGRGRLGGGGG